MLAEPASPTEPAICASQPDRTGDLRGHVGQNVAVKIRHYDHVKGVRRVCQLRGADIHDPVFVLDVVILGGDFVEDPVKQTVGQFHDVVFGEAGNFLAVVSARVLKSITNNFFRARTRYQFQTLRHLVGLAVLNAGVKVFFVLADDDHVHAGMLCLDERMIGNARPHVRVQAEHLAHGDVQTLEAAALWRSDWRLEKNFGVAERFPRTGFDAGAVSAQINFLADVDFLDIQLRARFL